ncbi:MAG: radical SAM protein [Pedosphaera sp. Tous-C6FEB]|nr:MAG: radical SAM protein [Pedosphaera sp. Tous-C6FEB]
MATIAVESVPPPAVARRAGRGQVSGFGAPRNFLGNRFVYVVLSPRSRGLAVGVNLNPDRECNFDCAYCEVDRRSGPVGTELDVDVMGEELGRTLALVRSGGLAAVPAFHGVPPYLLRLQQVNLSGDGEPTIAPAFLDAIHAVLHVRARCSPPFFKLVLLTNATGLNRPAVAEGIRCLTNQDEVWAKLDAGTQTYFEQVCRTRVPLAEVLANILGLARKRPVVIQSLFPLIDGKEPPEMEIREYASRLMELKLAGAALPLVQIYSANRPTANPACGHLPLSSLSRIARVVREVTGLRAEVF